MRASALGPVALLGVAAAVYVAAARIPAVPVPGALGPGVWPRLAAVGLALASLARLVEVLLARRQPGLPAPGASAAAPPDYDRVRLAAALVALGLYAAAAPVVGFPLANALFLATFMWVAGLRRPVRAGALSVAITVALLYLFVKVVYLPLPRGEGAFHDATLGLYRALGLM
jgi:putative tricarboxylic transport membrane protein